MKTVLPTARKILAGCFPLLAVLAAAPCGRAQVSLTGSGYTQGFNSLVDVTIATSSFYDWTDNYTIPGWYAALTTGDAVTRIRATNGPTGLQTTPLSISRASGSAGTLALAGGTFSDSTVKHGVFGIQVVNATGATITGLTIAYRGKQWVENTGGADRLDFQYSLDATALSSGTWTDYNALDFNAPKTDASVAAALNGNNTGNYTDLASSITGLAIAPGQSFWLRWVDFDATDGEQVLGVDDFSLSAVTAVPEPSVSGLLAAGAVLALTAIRRRRMVCR